MEEVDTPVRQAAAARSTGDTSTPAGGETGGLRSFLSRHERAAFVLLLVVGLMARVAWVSQDGRLGPLVCETYNAAICFARTGGICDDYFPGQGPTATANPVLPAIIGLVYRAFGAGSLTSEMVLTAFSLTTLCATLVAFYLAFRRLGLAVEWRLLALAAALLLPINFKWETVSFRLFEGGASVALLAVSLLLVLRLDARRDPLGPRDYLLPAVLVGLLALINPPAALGAYGALGVLTLKRVPVRRWLGVALVMTVGLAVFIAPWGLRNERVFGRLILARSTFPLEHALAFHQGAVSPPDRAAAFVRRGAAIHPYSADPASPARAEFARIGEIAYMDRLAAETKAWERTHPLETIHLAARHLVEFWLPPRWSWTIFGNTAPLVLTRMVFVWATTFAAFAAVAWRLVRAPLGPGLYLACVLLIPSLTYALVQPIQRYRYLVVLLTYFLAADFAARVAAYAAKGRFSRQATPRPHEAPG
ncbi:MAG TPA: hypothetical protein VGC92_10610 [Phenylobacterium sp.]